MKSQLPTSQFVTTT